MKNLNYLLATALTLTLSTAVFAAKTKAVVVLSAAEVALDKVRTERAEVIKQAASKNNPKCKFSKDSKKFYAVMTRNEKDRGTSVTVYNLDTNEVILTVTPKAAKTIRNFKLTDKTLVVKYLNKSLKAKTYSIVEVNKECKKCKRVLETQAVGTLVKVRAFGFIPASKK